MTEEQLYEKLKKGEELNMVNENVFEKCSARTEIEGIEIKCIKTPNHEKDMIRIGITDYPDAVHMGIFTKGKRTGYIRWRDY